ncbi:hypothetical protein ONR75_15730 [Rhodopseudomonas sp. P2A-2r]|uniref:hypothetical protein n=1 Tax=Rhodopseudomonas sp. P2A-2r TaxID=2991972 RepID=UPI0022345F42|nr:hypothetical protein [Rhodopseudomonas sp. P2A-2r]UZE51883.1 hypothetical protein ONR75_15730 [Rhodopseudomonas sp. P2A-2r]
MKNATTHNDNDTWQTLAAATARVVSKLEEKQSQDRADDGAEHHQHEQEEKERREYVEYRLRQLAKFEAQARGFGRRTR